MYTLQRKTLSMFLHHVNKLFVFPLCESLSSDLFVGLLYVLPNCIFERFLEKWEKYSCFIFYGYCTNVTIFASTFLIVVLTIDRLFVIVRPLSASTKGNRYRYGLVSGAWMLALILTIPYALHIRFSDTCTEHGINICWHDFKHMEVCGFF